MSYDFALVVEAVKSDDYNTVKKFMEGHVDINMQHNGRSLLHHAVSVGNLSIVQLLLHINVKFYEKTTLQWVGGQLTSSNEDIQRIHKANVSQPCSSGLTPLHCAVSALGTRANGNVELYDRRLKILKLLQQCGSNVNALDNSGRSALGIACTFKNTRTVQDICRFGLSVDVNIRSPDTQRTPLMISCVAEDSATAMFLMHQEQCNLHAIDTDGNNALYHAAEHNLVTVMHYLIQMHADTRSALQLCAAGGRAAILDALLASSGANIRNNESESLLMVAVRANDRAAVALQQNHRANAKAVERNGKTALMIANELHHLDIVALLNSKDNSNSNSESNDGHRTSSISPQRNISNDSNCGQLALIAAAKENCMATAQILLRCKADPNYAGSEGKTAQHWAAQFGYKYMVLFLLDERADPGCLDYSNKSALNYAVQRNYDSIVELQIATKGNKDKKVNDDGSNDASEAPVCNNSNAEYFEENQLSTLAQSTVPIPVTTTTTTMTTPTITASSFHAPTQSLFSTPSTPNPTKVSDENKLNMYMALLFNDEH